MIQQSYCKDMVTTMFMHHMPQDMVCELVHILLVVQVDRVPLKYGSDGGLPPIGQIPH